VKKIDYNDVLELMNQYQKANPTIVKTNFRRLRNINKQKPEHWQELFGLDYWQLYNYCNPVSTSIISFELALKICIEFNITIDELISEVE
jgi:hypothetical protein